MEKQENQNGSAVDDKWLESLFNETITETEDQPEQTQENALDNFFEQKVKEESSDEVKKEEEPLVDNFYSRMAKELLESGDWEDGEIELEVDGKTTRVIISEMEMTPELFKQVKAAQKLAKEEEIKEKYISLDGLDDSTKKLIDIKRKGGDISEILEVESKYVHPLQGVDLDDEDVQEELVRRKLTNQGIHPKTVEAEIKRLKEDLILDKAAYQIKDEIDKYHQDIIEKKKAELEEQIEQRKVKQKEDKKKVTEIYRGFELDDNLVKHLVEATVKEDEQGLTQVEREFFNVKEKNPELFAKVALMLTDEEKFKNFFGTKSKNEVVKGEVRKLFKLPKNSSGTSAVDKENPLDAVFKE